MFQNYAKSPSDAFSILISSCFHFRRMDNSNNKSEQAIVNKTGEPFKAIYRGHQCIFIVQEGLDCERGGNKTNLLIVTSEKNLERDGEGKVLIYV